MTTAIVAANSGSNGSSRLTAMIMAAMVAANSGSNGSSRLIAMTMAALVAETVAAAA